MVKFLNREDYLRKNRLALSQCLAVRILEKACWNNSHHKHILQDSTIQQWITKDRNLKVLSRGNLLSKQVSKGSLKHKCESTTSSSLFKSLLSLKQSTACFNANRICVWKCVCKLWVSCAIDEMHASDTHDRVGAEKRKCEIQSILLSAGCLLLLLLVYCCL